LKDAYFFSHDANARRDLKVKALMSVYGDGGYGRFWKLIEMLREEDGYRMERAQYVYDAFADEMKATPGEDEPTAEYAERFIDDCIERFKLLETDGDFFWSGSLCRRMKKMSDTAEKRRAAAIKRWADAKADDENKEEDIQTDANAMQDDANAMQDDANAMQDDAKKEKKEEKIKEKQPPSSDYTEDFKAFWQVYPRKMGKTAAFKAWNARLKEKVSPDDLIKAAKNYAAKCKAEKTEERYIKHAETFLGPNKRYEDYLGGNPDDPPEKPLTPGQIRIREALEKMKDIEPLI
jgi:hypothetical protein